MKETLSLDGPWRFNWRSNLAEDLQGVGHLGGGRHLFTGDWLEAEVPGTAHADLLRAGRILDPYVDRRLEDCRWIEEEDFYYARRVTIPARWQGRRIFLECEGLDCFASLYLDGHPIGTSENAFVEHRFDLTRYARPGEVQTLLVVLESPLRATKDKRENFLPASRNRSDIAYIRRPAMSFGWDFAPRLVGCGIWRTMRLAAEDEARIDSAWLFTRRVEEGVAEVTVEAEIVSNERTAAKMQLQVELKRGSQVHRARVPVALKRKRARLRIPFRIPKPALWYPHTHGRPNLYDLHLQLAAGRRVMDEKREKVGIRQVRLLEQPREGGGTTFTFEINGKPIYCRGANWVPGDSLRLDSSPERYSRLLELARWANMNMLRVWGGGIYESETFYALCDRLGILVWQDFMFACNLYPDHDAAFLKNVESEANKAVKRLRRHPSIVVWCGNNENDWIWDMGHWKAEEGVDRYYGERIYHDLLPRICKRLDPTRPYRPSSPYGGPEPNSDEAGHIHDWRIWHGKQLPEAYGERNGSFVTEFGLQGAPHIATARRMLSLKERWPLGKSWKVHHCDLSRMRFQMRRFGQPKDLAEYIQLSQMAQAEGLRTGIEIFRRRLGRCSGSLVWQLDEPWPTHCWSLVDHFLRPKGAYFAVRRAYSNPLVSLARTREGLEVWAVNDSTRPVQGRLALRLQELGGPIRFREEKWVEVEPGTSRCVEVLKGKKLALAAPRKSFWGARLTGDDFLSQNVYFSCPWKRVEWPEAQLSAWLLASQEERYLVLASKTYTRWVQLSTPDGKVDFEDNYFDLWPGEEKSILLPREAALPLLVIQAWNLPGQWLLEGS